MPFRDELQESTADRELRRERFWDRVLITPCVLSCITTPTFFCLGFYYFDTFGGILILALLVTIPVGVILGGITLFTGWTTRRAWAALTLFINACFGIPLFLFLYALTRLS